MSVKPFNFFAVDSRSPGLMAVVKKELSDHFTSFRFYILFFLIGIASISAVYVAALTIRKAVSAAPDINFVFMWLFTTSGRELPPFINFVGFLAPLIGIALGFDAINSERLRGSLSFVLAQPLHRDALINGKFLAGLLTITLMLTALFTFVGGLGLLMTGVPPVTEEVLRILFFLLLSILYVAFWLGLAILFSIIFRQTSTSALACIGTWLFFVVFFGLLASLVANALVPVGADATSLDMLRNQNLELALSRFSPTTLYHEAAGMLLIPQQRTLGPVMIEQLDRAIPGLLPFSQSLALVWPHFVGLLAATAAVFAISYIKFMRTEIRAA